MATQAQSLLNRSTQSVGKDPFSAPNRFLRLRPLRAVFLIAVASTCLACSNKALYENIQQNQLRACESLPIPQQTQCKALYDTSYEEYRHELEQIDEN